MGRPRKVPAPAFTVTATPPGTDGEGGEAPDAQTTDILGTIEDEGRRRAEGRIFRLDPATRKMALLDTVDASLADEGYVRENYGGGEYSIQMWGPRRDGSWGYLKQESKSYRIDSSVPFKGAPRDRAINAPAQNGVTPAPGSSIVDMAMIQLLNGFQEQSKSTALMQRDHSAAMMAMMERLATPRESFSMEKVVALVASLTPLVSPLISGMVNKKDPVEIATTLMAAMRPESNKSTLSSLHEVLEIKDLLGAFGAAPENEDAGWMRIFEKVLPGAVEILKNESLKTGQPITQLARQPAVARIGAPVTAPSAAPTSPIPGNASSVDGVSSTSGQPIMPQDEWTALEPYVQQLVSFAQQGKPPFGVVQTVLTFAPPPMIAGIRELVAREDALEFLIQRFPVLAQYRDWTDELLDEFYAAFHPHEEDEPEIPGAGEGEPSDGVTS